MAFTAEALTHAAYTAEALTHAADTAEALTHTAFAAQQARASPTAAAPLASPAPPPVRPACCYLPSRIGMTFAYANTRVGCMRVSARECLTCPFGTYKELRGDRCVSVWLSAYARPGTGKAYGAMDGGYRPMRSLGDVRYWHSICCYERYGDSVWWQPMQRVPGGRARARTEIAYAGSPAARARTEIASRVRTEIAYDTSPCVTCPPETPASPQGTRPYRPTPPLRSARY
eukprot:617771-Rhodomonas_salina.2